jgi:hypothetical protein
MPSGAYYLPRASKAPRLAPGILAGYRALGWTTSALGNLGTGQVVGRCALCYRASVVYGQFGRPTCLECRGEAKPR